MAGDNYNISGQAGAVGPNARADFHNMISSSTVLGCDFQQLAHELERMIDYARSHAATGTEFEAIAALVRREMPR